METFSYWILVTFFLNTCHTSLGFFAYDCGEQLSNLTTISLLDVGECDLRQPPVNITKTYGQLLQLNEFGMVRTFKCSVKVTRIVTYCGMHSHSSRMLGGEISYYHEVTRDACLKVQETGFLSISGRSIDGIKPNSTIQKSLVFAGDNTHDGDCHGGPYSDPYGSWEKVYVAGWIEIKIQDSYQPVRLANDRVKLASGVTCVFSETACIDEDGANVYWSLLPEDSCGTNKYSILYEGNIDKIYESEGDRTMYSLETEDITFALWKKGQRKFCGYTVEGTEHPKLYVLENARDNGFLRKTSTASVNLDIFTYMNSKFLYVEKYVRKQINLMYYDILRQQCELEKKIMGNALALAAVSPEEVAFRIMNGPGYLAVTAGEVIHLVKCLRVEVKRRDTNVCYEQLPVYRNNEEYFMTPRTRILVRTGKQIPCDRNLPAMFQLHEIWFKLLPEAIEVKNPETLKPQTKPTWQYVSPESLAVSGVYSEKDQNRLRDMILFPIEKPSVLNKLALGMSGRQIDTSGMTLNNFLNPDVISQIAESAWNKMWSNFLTFGTASAGIIGVIMLCRLIKLLIDTVIHGYAIYSLYGFSIHLLGAIWNSVTQLLLHLAHQNNKKIDTVNEQASEEKLNKKDDEIMQRKLSEEHAYEKMVMQKQRVYPELTKQDDEII